MCTHFCLYLRGAQFTLLTDHRSLRWLQKFWNSDGMLAQWYMLLSQFSAKVCVLTGSSACYCGQPFSPMWPMLATGLFDIIVGEGRH